MGTRMLGINISDEDHDKLRIAASKYNTTMTDIVMAGIDKEILFRELQQKYSEDHVSLDDESFDTEAMIRQMVEQKEKIATEFIKRVIF